MANCCYRMDVVYLHSGMLHGNGIEQSTNLDVINITLNKRSKT